MEVTLRKLCLLFFVLLLPTIALGGAVEQSELLFNKACLLVKENPEQAERLFKQSVAEYPSFEGYYALGTIQFQQGSYANALNSFEKAFSISAAPEDMANALAMKGRALVELGRGREGLQAVGAALQLHPEHPDWMLQLAQAIEDDNAGKIASAEEIGRCLNPSRGINVTPKVDLSIRFGYDSYKLDSDGKKQVMELAKALGGDNLKGASFQVVGHTDLQGDKQYNKVLSRNRAKTVVRLLEKVQPKLKGHLKAIGRGMDAPVREEMNDNAHKVNRRVEVIRVKS